jgi:probable F420-dependent oxidoreductase
MGRNLKFAINCNAFTYTGDFAGMVEFIRRADALGFHNVRFIDHVVGFVAERHPEVAYTPYTHRSFFHECFTFMAYVAAITRRIGLVTGVLVLPQRQTALVAKQAAEVDFLSGGRLILGIGLGYNAVEFGALGASFEDRGRRIEEQIEVLRALWTRETVEYEGEWHRLADVNINPPPVQRPIPIWMGAGRMDNPIPPERVLQRIGRLADGWCPLFRIADGATTLEDGARQAIAKVRDYASQAGRDPQAIALELGFYPGNKSRQQQVEELDALAAAGATHIHLRLEGASTRELLDDLERHQEIMHLI